jgi:NAD(P)-dependent dehydrogenase (short-subunit alcohol dehydrogenase family)
VSTPASRTTDRNRDHRQEVAVVTGAASGIGAATVRRLRARGVLVVGVDLTSEEEADDLAWVQGDVAEQAVWEVVLARSRDRFDASPLILVLNAARIAIGSVTEVSDEEWRRVFDVNVFGAVRALRACLPDMIERRRGSVVAVASVNAFSAEQGLVAYNASKGALLQLTRTVAVDHARDGVRANCVCPGVTDTPLFRAHLGTARDPERFLAVRRRRMPLGRLLDPDEVAATVAFLASDDASGITGCALVVDAGLTASYDFRSGEEGG